MFVGGWGNKFVFTIWEFLMQALWTFSCKNALSAAFWDGFPIASIAYCMLRDSIMDSPLACGGFFHSNYIIERSALI